METLQTVPHSLYAAFDVFPSRKGAAIHINRFAQTLFTETNGGLLYVLGGNNLPNHQIENNVEIIRFGISLENYLQRALAFSKNLSEILEKNDRNLKIAHFRDIWSGIAILNRQKEYRTIFEVNGLPSVELPFSYSNISAETLKKIAWQEKLCLEQSDVIVTPSKSIKKKILSYGVSPAKISVIPNGADILPRLPRLNEMPNRYLIYFGALQPWQGVEVLLESLCPAG